ncbi:DNA glycosylase superfamily protein [Zea mays]|uniref:DNA glycosylase superfamily protein n=1 Tax=Zea mays TaxID=4577 RepID=A0A1D6JS94_MAIZE|nr:DNA glycosylase superfamily protein [Zea mays]
MEVCDELRSFEATGVYRLNGTCTSAGATYLDPVRLLNASYQRFRIVPSAYYSRSFGPQHQEGEPEIERPEKRRKRKRNQKPKPRELNPMERIAEARHQEAKPLLLNAHESLVKAKHLLEYISKTIKGNEHTLDAGSGSENNFVELGTSWRAPFYEITICFRNPHVLGNEEGFFHAQKTSFPLFNSLISVEGTDEAEGEFRNRRYILPRGSCFLMADFKRVRDLIPCSPNQGYNLIVVDPPWENGCVRQKEVYPTLPNKNFLYLPVQQLAHPTGALLVLWITNREKLRAFVEKKLLPSWGVEDSTVFYWLKVKPDGSLIGDLDLFHHRPYECLLLGYINVNANAKKGSNFKLLERSQVIMSVPGAHSRKPPLERQAFLQVMKTPHLQTSLPSAIAEC